MDGGYLYGGGVYVQDAKVSIRGSTLSGNRVNTFVDEWIGFGGGIHNSGGTLLLKDSAVFENVSVRLGSGGGISNGGDMIIENTSVGANTSPTPGGGIYNTGRLTLGGVTLARNTVEGVYSVGIGELPYPSGCDVETPKNCFFGGGGLWNEATGVVRISHSVVADNSVTRSGPSDCHGAMMSGGHTALGTDADNCSLQQRQRSDLVNIDARLGDFEDNGDAGNAHYPLLADSPLIDAAGRVSKTCSPRDQLGHRRVDGDRDGQIACDIGAVEWIPTRIR